MKTARRVPAPELPSLPCACAAIRRAARAVTQFYQRELRDSGLDVTQFTLLQMLERRGGTTQGELARVLSIDSTTLTRTLAPLLDHAWVAARQGKDRRAKLLRLTPKGARKLAASLEGWQAAQERLRAALGSENWQAVMTQMNRVAQTCVALDRDET